MKPEPDDDFKQNYQAHLKHLRLKGLRPKTIEAHSRAVRRARNFGFLHPNSNRLI